MKLTTRARLADLEASVKGLEKLVAGIHEECRRYQDRTDTMFVKILDDPSDGARILTLALPDNESGAETIGDYLREILRSIWDQRGAFDADRPLGFDNWLHPINGALIDAGMIEENDDSAAYKLIHAAIDAMAGPR